MTRTKTSKENKKWKLREASKFGPQGKNYHISEKRTETIIRKHRKGI